MSVATSIRSEGKQSEIIQADDLLIQLEDCDVYDHQPHSL